MFAAHEHHEAVSRWLGGVQRFATCGLTQIGVFRLLVMAAPMHGHPLSPGDAHVVLAGFTRDQRHAFLSFGAVSPEFVGRTSGHKAAFDDYLVQIAQLANCRLATMDRPLTSRWSARTQLVG